MFSRTFRDSLTGRSLYLNELTRVATSRQEAQWVLRVLAPIAKPSNCRFAQRTVAAPPVFNRRLVGTSSADDALQEVLILISRKLKWLGSPESISSLGRTHCEPGGVSSVGGNGISRWAIGMGIFSVLLLVVACTFGITFFISRMTNGSAGDRAIVAALSGAGLTGREKGLGLGAYDMASAVQPARELPEKSLFRIGEVSRLTATKTFVLRYWESEFPRCSR